MAERLDFEALWPFELGRYRTSKGRLPCIFEVVSFLDTGEIQRVPPITWQNWGLPRPSDDSRGGGCAIAFAVRYRGGGPSGMEM